MLYSISVPIPTRCLLGLASVERAPRRGVCQSGRPRCRRGFPDDFHGCEERKGEIVGCSQFFEFLLATSNDINLGGKVFFHRFQFCLGPFVLLNLLGEVVAGDFFGGSEWVSLSLHDQGLGAQVLEVLRP